MKSSIIPAHGRTWSDVYIEIQWAPSLEELPMLHDVEVYDQANNTTCVVSLSMAFIENKVIEDHGKLILHEHREFVPAELPVSAEMDKLEKQHKKIQALLEKLFKPIMQLPKEERENCIKQLEGKLINSRITDKIL